MTNGSVDNPGPPSARRRLLRGAFAAPAVLALHSGSALAASSNLRCVNNQVANPQLPAYQPPAGSPSDTWVRVRLWSLRPSQNATEVRWYVRGEDVDAVRGGRASIYNAFLRLGEWWQFDPASQATVGSKLTQQPVWAGGNLGVWTLDGGWVAVRVNASTTEAGIVGIVGSGSGGSAVSGSCWTSFVTGAL